LIALMTLALSLVVPAMIPAAHAGPLNTMKYREQQVGQKIGYFVAPVAAVGKTGSAIEATLGNFTVVNETGSTRTFRVTNIVTNSFQEATTSTNAVFTFTTAGVHRIEVKENAFAQGLITVLP
jgi:hypothetical protein